MKSTASAVLSPTSDGGQTAVVRTCLPWQQISRPSLEVSTHLIDTDDTVEDGLALEVTVRQSETNVVADSTTTRSIRG